MTPHYRGRALFPALLSLAIGAALLFALACRDACPLRGWRAKISSSASLPAPASTPAAEPAPREPLPIEEARMVRHIEVLAGEIGVRRAGTPAELRAAEYVARELESYGYTVDWMDVPLPNGRVSKNVFTELPGASPRVILIGAHLDSKPPSPGANDNASGVAVTLELARVLRDTVPPATLRFVGFGAEEIIDGNRNNHHFGSRLMAADDALRARLFSMTSLDQVAYGKTLYLENLGKASNIWRDHLSRTAKGEGMDVRCGVGKPWSDHEAFERRGIPVAYVHSARPPYYHTRDDRPEHINVEMLRQTAAFMTRAMMEAGDKLPLPTQ